MLRNRNKLFCDLHPACYAISLQKEICKRHIKNWLDNITGKVKIAKATQEKRLPNVVSSFSSNLIKRGQGIDAELQTNKVTNIMLACEKINRITLYPGETFSFWACVGKITKKKGYKHGRVIQRNVIKAGIGGGLCNLGNTIHLLILHSPLEVTEFHSHSDALAPEEGARVPFSSGTSVFYNNIDYRFKNNTSQMMQLLVWCDDEKLYGELRSEREFSGHYNLVEENHRFVKESGKYYRLSKIYKETVDRLTGEVIERALVLDNHSEVMYDYALLPDAQLCEEDRPVNDEEFMEA